ncbi:hypothetical protein EON65_31935 [archaeon]|nr:MAG: hypothetical protein EON65_31935 [archaeon]
MMEEVRILMPETPLKSSTNADAKYLDVLGEIEFQLLRCREDLVQINSQCRTINLLDSLQILPKLIGDVTSQLERLIKCLATGLQSAAKIDALLKDALLHTIEACLPSNLPFLNTAIYSKLIVRLLCIRILVKQPDHAPQSGNPSRLINSNLTHLLPSYYEAAFVSAFHAFDWASNSAFQRNKRISPAILVYTSVMGDFVKEVDEESVSYLSAQLIGADSNPIKAYANELVISLLAQVLGSMLQTVLRTYLLDLTQLSRVRHVQYRTDLRYTQLHVCSLIQHLTYAKEDLLPKLLSPLLPYLAVLSLQVHILTMRLEGQKPVGEGTVADIESDCLPLVSLIKEMQSVTLGDSSKFFYHDSDVLAYWQQHIRTLSDLWPVVDMQRCDVHKGLAQAWKDGADLVQSIGPAASLPPSILPLALMGYQQLQDKDHVEDGDAIRKAWVGVLMSRRYELLPGDYPALTKEEQNRSLVLNGLL